MTYETGIDLFKDSSDEKLINFTLSTPTKFWKIWEMSVGIDVKHNGFGFGFTFGGETSLNFYDSDSTYSIFSNIIGRVGVEFKYPAGNNIIKYDRLTFNVPEILLVLYGAEDVLEGSKYISKIIKELVKKELQGDLFPSSGLLFNYRRKINNEFYNIQYT